MQINLEIMPKFKIEYSSGEQTPSGGSAPVLENMYAGDTVILTSNPYIIYGYNFAGWTDGTNIYKEGDVFTIPENNIILSAVWNQEVWDGVAVTEPVKDADGYYMITKGSELAYFSDNGRIYDNIKLMCDIDMGGHSFKSIEGIKGVFDGQGFAVKNLNVVAINYAYVGFIGVMEGEVKNLILENATVTDTREGNTECIGLLAGYVDDKATVKNCFVEGVLDVNNKTTKRAGGLIGFIAGNASGNVIDSCFTEVEIKNFAQSATYTVAGGIVGSVSSGAEDIVISNSYSLSTFSDAWYASGIVGSASSVNTTIKNCYAAGRSLNASVYGYGISDGYANINNSVSIFSEINNANARISDFKLTAAGTNNYAFFGTNSIDNNGLIVEFDAAEKTTTGKHGADASLADITSQAFYEDTLGWDFENVWKMPDSESTYIFPVLKNQRVSAISDTVVDMTPVVKSITLNITDTTVYRGQKIQLTAYLDVLNGASKEVDWVSSSVDVAIDLDGMISVSPTAEAGEYTVTAYAKEDYSVWTTCNITVDTNSYGFSHDIQKGPYGEKPSVTFYETLEDAKDGKNPITAAQAGSQVYARTSPVRDDELLDIYVNDTYIPKPVYTSKESYLYTYIYNFTMPCGNAHISGMAMGNVAMDSYVWIVVTSMSSQGDTVRFSIDEWNDGTGYLKIDKILNGNKFVKFDVRNAYFAEGGKIELTENTTAASVDDLSNGEYCTLWSDEGLPILWLKLNGAGSVEVEIVVEEDENALYDISLRGGNTEYYELNTNKARAGETITATLTEAGMEKLALSENKKVLLNYGGGLLVVIFPPQFTLQPDGTYQASFTMPAQDIYLNVVFAEQTEISLTGEDTILPYNGQPQSIDKYITAITTDNQNASHLLIGRYDVTYTGIDGTAYESTSAAPSNVGNYECVVKVSDEDSLYKSSDTVTVKLTITKSTSVAPSGPKAIIRSANEITLTPPVAFADGKEIADGYIIEYKCNDGEWTENTTFTDLSQNTTYNFYARIKATDNNESSPQSEAVSITTPYGTPSADYAVIDFVNETIMFDSYLEINTTSEFDGTNIETGSSITPYIGTTVYMRVKALNTNNSEETVSVVIPKRPAAPKEIVLLTLNDNSVSLLSGENNEYKISDGNWQGSNVFENLNSATAYKLYQRVKATDSSFASEAVEKDITTAVTGGDALIILTETTVSVNNLSQTAALILASYENGKLMQIKTVPVSDDVVYNVSDIIELTTENELKAMLWKDLKTILPLCSPKTLSISK